MSFSLNEVESMAKRAARGAGFDWGLAEEAGKAVRWLTERDLPGAEALAQLLIDNDHKDYDELAPISGDGPWHARCGRLCPIACGAALSDRAQAIAAGRAVELGSTRQPLLLAPGAAAAARLSGSTIELSWDGVTMVLTADGAAIEGSQEALKSELARRVFCRTTQRVAIICAARKRGRAVNAESWSRLDDFAHRTFAPASEASRISGAGAGLEDNE